MLRSLAVALLLLLIAAPALAAAAARPSLTIKPDDVARARENVRRFPWAKAYADELMRRADASVERLSPALIETLIGPATPISTIFTPCPACRDLGKTWHPHGQWTWNVRDPDRLTCELCKTVYPNEKYPETIVLKTSWGQPQEFSFVGGEPFVVFGYKTGRPSISACIRAKKVDYVTGECRALAEAYLLSGDARYARAVRLILLRLAEVYPHWLVHSGYGEIADMDPKIAAAKINALPADEIVYPPNKPDRALHTGYWSAGRATGHGQESSFVRAVAFAYDATCDAKDDAGGAIYPADERAAIEEKLLLESTYLLVADKQINNKSVGNRTAAALVGMALEKPELVDFGVEGFSKAVEEWFLPDGGTPESAAYAMMVFGNTLDMPLARRELFQSPRYASAWSAMIDGLQGDCTFAPYADTRPNRKIDSQWADLLAWQYPQRGQYLALLKSLCGDDLREATARFAIWYRQPELANKAAPPLSFPTFCLPELRIGHMRTGRDGRESLLMLDASHWGSHHHLDSLNLYYWKDGKELLSDLGYLWDNPKKKMTARTLAHNTVIVDEADQLMREREGRVHFFIDDPRVKAMRASSKAYAQARRYERTSAIIDHGGGRSYVVDFFLVEGGKIQDYVFHGPNDKLACSLALQPAGAPLYDLAEVMEGEASAIGTIQFDMGDNTLFTAHIAGQEGERLFIGSGWGQRDPFNADRGATLPYIVRRCRGDDLRAFVTVFETHPPRGQFVRGVKRLHNGKDIAIEVETSDSSDYIQLSSSGLRVTSKQGQTTNWTFSHEQ